MFPHQAKYRSPSSPLAGAACTDSLVSIANCGERAMKRKHYPSEHGGKPTRMEKVRSILAFEKCRG